MNSAIFLVAVVAIGSGSSYYFPDGPPHRPLRQLPVNDSLHHPEPKLFNPEAKGPLIKVITMEGTRFVDPRPQLKSDGNDTHPEPRAMGLQLVPKRKDIFPDRRRQASSCQMNYAFSNPGDSAVIQSADYPNDYPNNLQSSVCFSSPAGTTMSVSCTDFNVEYERSCSYDFFGLGLRGDPSSVQKYCGQGSLQSPASSGNSLAVVFKSDYSNPGSSGRSAYRFSCRVSVSGSGSTPTSTLAPPVPPPGGDGCECGLRNDNRIVGGQDAKVNEFPWRCYLKTNRYSFFCGCSVISENWILTAAHCTAAVMPLQNGDVLYAVVGDHDRSSTSEARSQQIAISQVVDHKDYNDNTMDYDVSLLKLSQKITTSRTISPVCLPWNYASEEFSGETVSASGWGTTTQGGQVSNTLKEVDLPVLTTQQCSRYYPGQITNNMICTYQPGKDTCQGDSGGSIDMQRNGRYYNIGVVSWGIGCARENNPGVYAKTTKYLDWITQNTAGESFCRA